MLGKRFCLMMTAAILISSCNGLTAKQEKVAEEALSELRKLDAATDIGISKLEYSKMLITAQSASTEAVSTLQDGELKTAIKGTMASFLDAKTIWFLMGDDDHVFACAIQPDKSGKEDSIKRFIDLECNPEAGEIVRKYGLTLRAYQSNEIVNDKGRLDKKEAISFIWQSAKEKLKTASDAFNKTK
jgi:hypothetical protein